MCTWQIYGPVQGWADHHYHHLIDFWIANQTRRCCCRASNSILSLSSLRLCSPFSVSSPSYLSFFRKSLKSVRRRGSLSWPTWRRHFRTLYSAPSFDFARSQEKRKWSSSTVNVMRVITPKTIIDSSTISDQGRNVPINLECRSWVPSSCCCYCCRIAHSSRTLSLQLLAHLR